MVKAELPITATRPYLTALWHHPWVIKNLLDMHGSPEDFLHAVPTPEGFNQIRGMVRFAGKSVLEQWDALDEQQRGNRPAVELVVPAASTHSQLIARFFRMQFERRQQDRTIDPGIELIQHDSERIANIPAGWLNDNPDELTPRRRAAVDRFNRGFAAWKRGELPEMPKVPGGPMHPRRHLVRVIEGEYDLAQNHVGQFVIQVLTTSACHASLAALEIKDNVSLRALARGEVPYPYIPAPPHGSAHLYQISQSPPQRLTEQPVALTIPPEMDLPGAGQPDA